MTLQRLIVKSYIQFLVAGIALKENILDGCDNEYQRGYYRNSVISSPKYIVTPIDFSFFSGNTNVYPGP